MSDELHSFVKHVAVDDNPQSYEDGGSQTWAASTGASKAWHSSKDCSLRSLEESLSATKLYSRCWADACSSSTWWLRCTQAWPRRLCCGAKLRLFDLVEKAKYAGRVAEPTTRQQQLLGEKRPRGESRALATALSTKWYSLLAEPSICSLRVHFSYDVTHPRCGSGGEAGGTALRSGRRPGCKWNNLHARGGTHRARGIPHADKRLDSLGIFDSDVRPFTAGASPDQVSASWADASVDGNVVSVQAQEHAALTAKEWRELRYCLKSVCSLGFVGVESVPFVPSPSPADLRDVCGSFSAHATGARRLAPSLEPETRL